MTPSAAPNCENPLRGPLNSARIVLQIHADRNGSSVFRKQRPRILRRLGL